MGDDTETESAREQRYVFAYLPDLSKLLWLGNGEDDDGKESDGTLPSMQRGMPSMTSVKSGRARRKSKERVTEPQSVPVHARGNGSASGGRSPISEANIKPSKARSAKNVKGVKGAKNGKKAKKEKEPKVKAKKQKAKSQKKVIESTAEAAKSANDGNAKVKAPKRAKSSKVVKAVKGKEKKVSQKKTGKAVKANKAKTSDNSSKKEANVEAAVVLGAVPAVAQVTEASEVEAEVKPF